MKTYQKIGLTLGKYAPLHKGHQLVIDKALKEMDQVIVLIYNAPETTNIPLTVRADWLRKIYPTIKVIEAKDGPTIVGNTPKIKKMHEDYIIKKLKIKNITAFYSSEFYGAHMSKALNATNIQVDPQRTKFPISSTKIRTNPSNYRQYLDPIVYKDLIINVVFLGAPSTGKTTIAERMAKEFHTEWMPEYGREYWEKNQINRRLSPEQLVDIAKIHLIKEDEKLLQSKKYLFTDTNAITTYIFALDYHKKAKPELKKIAARAKNRYDIVFLCDTDMPYDNTWDRSGDVKRKTFQKMIMRYLKSEKIKYYVLKGSINRRIKYVKKILLKYDKH